MYTTVIERTRDVGILKSIGASKGYIVKALLGETMLICGVGIVLGIILSYAARSAFISAYPTISINITISWIIRAAAISVGASLLGATYPSYLASGKDPVEALAYD